MSAEELIAHDEKLAAVNELIEKLKGIGFQEAWKVALNIWLYGKPKEVTK